MANAFMDLIARVALLAPGFIIAVSFHEYAHAQVAYWLGDNTAKRLGRLTIDPRRHFNLIGTLCLIFFGIGWADPVPFDERNFKYPRLYSILVAFAGPLSNIIMAYCFLTIIKYVAFLPVSALLLQTMIDVFNVVVYVNIMLALFNILPIPPLDGSHVLRVMLPKSWQKSYMVFSQFSILFLLLLLMLPTTRMLFAQSIMVTEQFLKMLVI